MQKKQGAPEAFVPATTPADSNESDKANPGEVQAAKSAQRQAVIGKYGSVPIAPFKASAGNTPVPQQTTNRGPEDKKEETSWIEIELVGDDDKPIPGEKYRITLPDGKAIEGTLDQKGQARAEGFEPGSCAVTFPDLDTDMWEEK